MLINLISNAIKFTSSGNVSVETKIQKLKSASETETQKNNNQQSKLLSSLSQVTTISFTVKDTGVGIAADELEKLFQPFLQTASGQRLQQGTGLGLTISRQFVRLMGGEITVISGGKAFTPGNSLDGGMGRWEDGEAGEAFSESSLSSLSPFIPSYSAIFKFDIPVKIVEANEVENQLHSRRIIALAPNQIRYRILVVDDREYNRQLLVKLLKTLGFEVQEATNGAEAIKIWNSYSPHLIWMDMRMPIMDGYEATKQIKSTTKGQATAVIALTASVWEEEKTVILSAGCDDFVRKPFHKEIIFDIMAKHLGVRYIYQEQEPLSRPANVARETSNFQDLLAAMSKEWIVKLHKASLDADVELVSQIFAEIPSAYAIELQTLRNWVNKFQFERILDLTEPLVTEE
ncbi:MAG: response regulator [Coleofasciculaceae cyanobacterium]